jgi:PTS system galactitol-specific IIA component
MAKLVMKSNERLIALNRSFENCSDTIAYLAGLARNEGLVEDLFVTKIQERELSFPTGLDMPVPLAIPHIGDGCVEPFISVATLDPPVAFKNMDLSGDEVHAMIVFLFGILDPKSQLAVLQKFAGTFSNGEIVSRLVASKTPGDLLREMNGILDGMLDVEL